MVQHRSQGEYRICMKSSSVTVLPKLACDKASVQLLRGRRRSRVRANRRPAQTSSTGSSRS